MKNPLTPAQTKVLDALGLEPRRPRRRLALHVGLTALGAGLGAAAVLVHAFLLGRKERARPAAAQSA